MTEFAMQKGAEAAALQEQAWRQSTQPASSYPSGHTTVGPSSTSKPATYDGPIARAASTPQLVTPTSAPPRRDPIRSWAIALSIISIILWVISYATYHHPTGSNVVSHVCLALAFLIGCVAGCAIMMSLFHD
jgi:hypothetical protein